MVRCEILEVFWNVRMYTFALRKSNSQIVVVQSQVKQKILKCLNFT